MLAGLEELDLGVGIGLGMGGQPAAPGGGNCRLTGGLQITDLGVAKLAKLKKLRRLNLSGARLTTESIQVLQSLPLEHLSLFACLCSSTILPRQRSAGLPTLAHLDLSYTKIDDDALAQLAKLPNLKQLYLTETKVTPAGCRGISEAASPDVCLVGEATGAARRSSLERKTRRRGNAMRFRIASLSLALTVFVVVASTPRAQNATPAPDPVFFQSQVFPVFEAAKCSGCHSPSGVASATRLHFPEKDATPAQIQAFGLSLSGLVDRADSSQSLLLTKPTNVARHTGGVRIKPGSPEEQILAKWVGSLASVSEATLAAAIEIAP